MHKLISYLILGTLAFAGGFYFPRNAQSQITSTRADDSHPIRQSGYHYINPLLECELGSEIENNSEIKSLKQNLVGEIARLKQNANLSHVSVYFRDLNNGPWFGIDEDSQFTPASLLKTPIMIAYLRQAESDPRLLTQKLIYDPQKVPQESPPQSLSPLTPNASYTIEELLERMIVHSDNQAFNLLTRYIDYEAIQQVHRDLGIALPSDKEDFISVREYASLFRVLFNSSYLSRTMSEKGLRILAQASYRDGLVAGVDKTIEVAHKYGVRHGDDGIEQLHDCGIVYYPGHPYLVCIMTKGHDFKTLTSTITDLSRNIYDEIKTRYPLQ